MDVEPVVGIAVSVVLGLVLLSVRRRVVAGEVATAFTGEVVDRRVVHASSTTGLHEQHWLVVRTDTGDVVDVPVRARVFDRFAVGDRITKRSGERWPERG